VVSGVVYGDRLVVISRYTQRYMNVITTEVLGLGSTTSIFKIFFSSVR
jgi:hypothetical protein